jgi:hypothetical protein
MLTESYHTWSYRHNSYSQHSQPHNRHNYLNHTTNMPSSSCHVQGALVLYISSTGSVLLTNSGVTLDHHHCPNSSGRIQLPEWCHYHNGNPVSAKAGHELVWSRLGLSRYLTRPFSARLGLAHWADEPRKRARPGFCINSVWFGVAREPGASSHCQVGPWCTSCHCPDSSGYNCLNDAAITVITQFRRTPYPGPTTSLHCLNQVWSSKFLILISHTCW